MAAWLQTFDAHLSDKIMRYAVPEGETPAIPLPPPAELFVCGGCAKSLREHCQRQYCSGCESMTYCGNVCQLADWKKHRLQCAFYRALIWSRNVLSRDKRIPKEIARKIVSYIAATPHFRRKQVCLKFRNNPLGNHD